MAAPISRKLVTDAHGGQWIVTGNPDVGYTVNKITGLDTRAHFRRSWEAVRYCLEDAGDE